MKIIRKFNTVNEALENRKFYIILQEHNESYKLRVENDVIEQMNGYITRSLDLGLNEVKFGEFLDSATAIEVMNDLKDSKFYLPVLFDELKCYQEHGHVIRKCDTIVEAFNSIEFYVSKDEDSFTILEDTVIKMNKSSIYIGKPKTIGIIFTSCRREECERILKLKNIKEEAI